MPSILSKKGGDPKSRRAKVVMGGTPVQPVATGGGLSSPSIFLSNGQVMTDIKHQVEIQELQSHIAELRIQNAMLEEKCQKYRDESKLNNDARDLKTKIASLITFSEYDIGNDNIALETLTLRLLKTGIDFDTIMELVKSNYMLMSEWERFMVAIRMAEK